MPNKERLIKLIAVAAVICVSLIAFMYSEVHHAASDGAKAACEFQYGAGNCVKSAINNEWVARGSR